MPPTRSSPAVVLAAVGASECNPSGMSGEDKWLKVEGVTLSTYAPERIVVSVSMETYDLDDLRRAFEAIDAGEKP